MDKKVDISDIAGDVIVSVNQKGGQTAHEIQNKNEQLKGVKQPTKPFWMRKEFWIKTVILGIILSVIGSYIFNYLNPTVTKGDLVEVIKNSKTDNNGDKINISNVAGDVVVSADQKGGQTAHTIINVGGQKRTLK